ncbi:hypothetical protein NMY22_g10400 [Coprinellus aureogranulatus]|nr:hypothetical protein NMY22_g10400 [Coprinellus aureogranulatus]
MPDCAQRSRSPGSRALATSSQSPYRNNRAGWACPSRSSFAALSKVGSSNIWVGGILRLISDTLKNDDPARQQSPPAMAHRFPTSSTRSPRLNVRRHVAAGSLTRPRGIGFGIGLAVAVFAMQDDEPLDPDTHDHRVDCQDWAGLRDRQAKAHSFQVNDYVWLSAKNIAIKVPTRKLGDLYLGPFKITEKVGDLDYRLQLPDTLSRLHPVFHVDKLYPWKGSDVNGILPPPPDPIELDGEEEWEVQEVLDSRWTERRTRKRGRKKAKVIKELQYLGCSLSRSDPCSTAPLLAASAPIARVFATAPCTVYGTGRRRNLQDVRQVVGRTGFSVRENASADVSPVLDVCSVLIAETDNRSMKVPMTLIDSFRNIETRGLVDCAAGGRFIDQDFAKKHRLPVKTLTRVLTANNVDGTPNKNGVIREYVQLPITVHGRTSNQKFFITGLGKQNVILGMPWIRQMNPLIDWKLGTLEWRKHDFNSLRTGRPIKPPDPTDISQLLVSISQIDADYCPEPLWIRLKTTASQTLAIANNAKKVEKPIEELVPKPYHKYLHIFTKEFGEHFPPERPDDMPINLKGSFEPKVFKEYTKTEPEKRAVEAFLEENLRLKRIRPSNSPMASPFFFVNKKDGKLRPVQDYCYLNEHTVSDAYPLPQVDDLLRDLKDAKYFSKIDLKWGYNNLQIKEGDQWKAAFMTHKGLFEPTVMFFGLKNSPPVFQRFMDKILTEPGGNPIPIWRKGYMDDVLIPGRTMEELRKNTMRVLAKMEKNGLPINPKKCAFEVSKIDFLGYIIQNGRLEMDPEKVEGLRGWPPPKDLTDLRKFLGFGNFYRRFIHHYSNLARPLHNLLKKDTPFAWTEECNQAFLTLKEKFTSYPVLTGHAGSKPHYTWVI